MTTKLRTGSPEKVGMLPERVARVRDLCARWVTEGHKPTLGVCVTRRGVIVLLEAFGVLGPGPDSPPLSGDALFPALSVTKAITATLVMQLVEDGLLGLKSTTRMSVRRCRKELFSLITRRSSRRRILRRRIWCS